MGPQTISPASTTISTFLTRWPGVRSWRSSVWRQRLLQMNSNGGALTATSQRIRCQPMTSFDRSISVVITEAMIP